MNIKGTKSEQNIKIAFAGESQARNKYNYYAIAARSEGHDDIADLFNKMAENEREHAKIWFKLLNDGLGETEANLRDSAGGENYEWKTMYPEFAAQAREDGLEMLAIMFEKVAAIENDHERRFLDAFVEFTKKTKSDNSVEQPNENVAKEKTYRCMFCGVPSDHMLDVCPVCEAIGAFERV